MQIFSKTLILRLCRVAVKRMISEVRLVIASDSSVHCFFIRSWHKVLFLISVLVLAFVSFTTITELIIERRDIKKVYGELVELRSINHNLKKSLRSMHSELSEISRYFDFVSGKDVNPNGDILSNKPQEDENSKSGKNGFFSLFKKDSRIKQCARPEDVASYLTLVKNKVNSRIVKLSSIVSGTGISFAAAKKVNLSAKHLLRSNVELDSKLDCRSIDRNITLADVVDNAIELEKLAAYLPIRSPLHEYRVTSSFGIRVDPFHGHIRTHGGLDLRGVNGADVIATGAGKVIFAGAAKYYGNMVDISHGYGIVTRYAHLNSLFVDSGDVVSAGHVLGSQGSTGRSSGEHLHYEVRRNGKAINPNKFILSDVYVKKIRVAQGK